MVSFVLQARWVAVGISLLVLLTAGGICAAADDPEKDCLTTVDDQKVVPLTLRVALYPFTPDRLALFQKIEAVFECEHPGVNVVLVTNSNSTYDYYSDNEEKKRGFRFVDADIYEIDTILLSDFVALNKVAPIDLPYDDFAPEAVAAVTRDGRVFGVPHWLCGNFLFYHRADTTIREARTWKELLAILDARREGLLVDFKGRSTLGEWYFTVLSALVGVDAAQKQITSEAPLNADAVSDLKEILAICPVGYCRSEALHDNTGYYARAFVRGQAPIYLGYSESIYYGLREMTDDCLPTSGCLSKDDIAVRALPQFDVVNAPSIGWVDALAIDARLSGYKKEVALKFIKRTLADDVYESMLEPEWPYGSRYLLPARKNVKVEGAPLYKEFLEAHQGRVTGELPGLNAKLRAIGERVNCALPIDRDDEESLKNCPIPSAQ